MNSLHLFAGVGGAALGFQRAGIKPVAFCEINPAAQRVLRKHWPDAQYFDDVKDLKGNMLNVRPDIITGGFPCQDISLAGAGAGLAGARSGLWFEQLRIIDEIRPSYVLAENVSALRSRGLDAVLGSLAEIGYDAEWHCIPASAIGAPHQRDRIWIVAYPACELWDRRGTIAEQTGRVEPSNGSGALAYSDGQSGDARRSSNASEGTRGWNAGRIDVQGLVTGGTDTQEWKRQIERSAGPCRDGLGWWATEPDVGRVAHGVPGRVDRLKGLGNSVVPQLPEMIGRIILSQELLG